MKPWNYSSSPSPHLSTPSSQSSVVTNNFTYSINSPVFNNSTQSSSSSGAGLHSILSKQLDSHFQVDDMRYIWSNSQFSQRFKQFVEDISKSYTYIDNNYTIAKKISNIAQKQQEKFNNLEFMFNEIQDIISLLSLSGEPLYNSPTVKDILGYDIQTFLSLTEFDQYIHRDDIHLFHQSINSLFETKEPQLFCYRVMNQRELTLSIGSEKNNHLSSTTNKSNEKNFHLHQAWGEKTDKFKLGYNDKIEMISSPYISSDVKQEMKKIQWIWLETSANIRDEKIICVTRIIPVNTFIGKLRTDEERLRMSERVLRQIRKALFNPNPLPSPYSHHHYYKSSPSSITSPRSTYEWSQFINRLKDNSVLMKYLESSHSESISVFDANGVFLYISPACQQLYGFKQDDYIGHLDEDFIHPEDINFMIRLKEQTPEKNSSKTSIDIFRRLHLNGSYIWIERTSFIHRDDNFSKEKNWHHICIERDTHSLGHVNRYKQQSSQILYVLKSSSFLSIYRHSSSILSSPALSPLSTQSSQSYPPVFKDYLELNPLTETGRNFLDFCDPPSQIACNEAFNLPVGGHTTLTLHLSLNTPSHQPVSLTSPHSDRNKESDYITIMVDITIISISEIVDNENDVLIPIASEIDID